MLNRRSRSILAAGGALVVLGGAGGAIAATRDSSRGQAPPPKGSAGTQAVQPGSLLDMFRSALVERIDAAVASGALPADKAALLKAQLQKLTPARVARLRALVEQAATTGSASVLGPVGGYLGLTTQQLLAELHAGKSLAQIATAHGKTAAGLKQTITTAVRADLDQAVTNGVLSASAEQKVLDRLSARVDSLLNRTLPASHS